MLATRWAARPGRAWALSAFLVGSLLYAPTIRNGFVFDDVLVIVKNRFLRSLDTLPQLVSEKELVGAGYPTQQWRPLTSLTHAVNHMLGGLAPWGYHATNALLHGVVSLLVVLVGIRLGLAPAAAGAGAVLFAVHPIHVEAVASVVGRKEVLATLLLLLMLLAHRRAVGRGGLAALAPIAAYAGAMLSKEIGTVGLGLAVLHDLLAEGGAFRGEGGSARRRAMALYAAYAGTLAGYLLLYRAVTGGVTLQQLAAFADNPAAHATVGVRLMTAVAVLGKGLALQALPVGQSADWSYDAIPLVTSPADLRFVASVAAFVAWLAAGLRLRRSRPIVLLALGWYAAAVSPVANVLFPTGTIFGERLLYLPSVALALLAGAAFVEVRSRASGRGRAVVTAAGAALLAVLAIASARYSAAWADELHLFTWARESAPRSTKVHLKLAEALAAAERPEEARREVRLSLEILPSNTNAMYEAACIERDAGRLDEAAALWRQVLAASPRDAYALADLAAWDLLRGDDAAAEEHAERAIEAAPDLANAWYNLALVLRRRGETARAHRAFTRFVETAGSEYAPEAAAVRRELESGAY